MEAVVTPPPFSASMLRELLLDLGLQATVGPREHQRRIWDEKLPLGKPLEPRTSNFPSSTKGSMKSH